MGFAFILLFWLFVNYILEYEGWSIFLDIRVRLGWFGRRMFRRVVVVLLGGKGCFRLMKMLKKLFEENLTIWSFPEFFSLTKHFKLMELILFKIFNSLFVLSVLEKNNLNLTK